MVLPDGVFALAALGDQPAVSGSRVDLGGLHYRTSEPERDLGNHVA